VRNACTAGYKGILQDGEYPSEEFEAALNPAFKGFAATKLAHPIGQLGTKAGGLTAEAAAWTGLPEGIAVAVGNVDAHVTAPAAKAVEPGQMLAIMGTSTRHRQPRRVYRHWRARAGRPTGSQRRPAGTGRWHEPRQATFCKPGSPAVRMRAGRICLIAVGIDRLRPSSGHPTASQVVARDVAMASA
jgi:hypothetical protein